MKWELGRNKKQILFTLHVPHIHSTFCSARTITASRFFSQRKKLVSTSLPICYANVHFFSVALQLFIYLFICSTPLSLFVMENIHVMSEKGELYMYGSREHNLVIITLYLLIMHKFKIKIKSSFC